MQFGRIDCDTFTMDVVGFYLINSSTKFKNAYDYLNTIVWLIAQLLNVSALSPLPCASIWHW
jgi:hypothetical protein